MKLYVVAFRQWTWIVLLVLLVACSANTGQTEDPVAEGQRLFGIWCSGCHAVEPGGPDAIGPNLAGVATRAAANAEGLTAEEWLLRETIDPNAQITPGYNPGLMPANYEQTFRPEQLDALVTYMLTLE